MKRFTVEITKELHDQLSEVDFNSVSLILKALSCTINLDGEDEKDHKITIEMEIPEENQMNIDKLEVHSEEQPKRVKVEFVKCEFNHAWEALKAFEDGEVLYRDKNQTLETNHNDFVVAASVGGIGYILTYYKKDNLYRRIETEITERDEFIESVGSLCDEMDIDMGKINWIAKTLFDSGKFKLVDGK